MRIRTPLAVTTAIGLAVGAAGLVAPPARAARTQAPIHHVALRATADTSTTLNWSGYVVAAPAGKHVTAVHTEFVVPRAQTMSPGGAAIWTGIGGWTGSDLIQAGVSVGDLQTGGAAYPWFEMLPAPETPIFAGCAVDPTCTVNAGDKVKVAIINTNTTAPYQFSIKLEDVGHWTWTRSFTYASSTLSSAEWILEAPSLIVAPMFVPFMDDTTFGPDDTYGLEHHHSSKMATGSPHQVNMAVLGLIPEAQPSPLAADRTSFRGCAFKSNCQAPG
jgi:hypothetical protein